MFRRLARSCVAAASAFALACGGGGGTTSPSPMDTAAAQAGIEATPLKQAGVAAGRLVGTAVKSSLLREATYAGVFARHFDFVTAEYEMKWGQIERVQGQRDYAGGDAIVDFALARGI